jgi:hypothetical protein
MVKNTTGGTKTKGLARKHVNGRAGGGRSVLRLPEDKLEIVVAVGSMLGNGMCEVFNNDGERFIAHIRNKFKGRHKRSNLIATNKIILCGYREWEKPFKNLDVIFIYDDDNIDELRNIPTITIHNLFTRIDSNKFTTTFDNTLSNDFKFTANDQEHELYTPTPTPTPTPLHDTLHIDTLDLDLDLDLQDI